MKQNETTVGTLGSSVRNTVANATAQNLPRRKSPRAKFHSYSGGNYFVTICTHNMKHHFGSIHDNKMYYTPIGDYCFTQLQLVSSHYSYVSIPAFVVMPKHIHAIVCIDNPDTRTLEPSVPTPNSQNPTKLDLNETTVGTLGSSVRVRSLLSVIIGNIKRSVTMYAKRNGFQFEWQKRYHDHIIRGSADGNLIAEYIAHNVDRWHNDCFYC